ncbi:mandelate racemase/muconate lactonizing enzyme family protein [Enterovirga rhinocerotis]|uniref:L-alanine-DL-glutamate epimerase-like enolase superfamily enzyme n=1 Tax=Enterovirga rhinocerotis TaxID=1339210 RepID=A0A4R7C3Y1_9HYPH|nr:mandelate racemase/muconate lactonizing enzyme family protein [Enterovirga rhinocerotis]TDR93164.1 L-alanine-DL-glutamate epimerase-like enolase superfamily enzyme [Enterovirga rhinocerotis]
MKIVSVESRIVSLPFDMGGPPAAFAGKPWTHLDILLVRVETDEGLVGWGEAFGHAGIHATRAALDTIVAPLVIGRSSGDIAELNRSILHAVHLLGRNGPFVYAFAGIEIALWDLAGKRANLPVARLLGGGSRTEMDAYASLLAYNDPSLVEKNTKAACKAGYRYIKLHEVTRETVAAGAKAAAKAGAKLMVDVNCLWSVPAALEMADAFRPHDLFWFEEPVWPPEDAQGLARVRACGIPIAAGENTAGLHGFKALVEAGAIDIAQPSVTKIGGITEMLRVFAYCTAHGVTVTPHCPYFGPGFIASLHIISALAERPLVEVLWLEMEANPFDPWVKPVDGRVKLPPGPGLGCDPDPAIVERYTAGEVVRTGGAVPMKARGRGKTAP